MGNEDYQEIKEEKTIEGLAEAEEILRLAQPSIDMSLALTFKDRQQGCLAPARMHIPENQDPTLYF